MTTAVGPEYVPPTDWSAYQMCPVCRAAKGAPCVARSGRLVFGRTGDRPAVTLAHPHTRRHMTSAAIRERLEAVKLRLSDMPHPDDCPCVLCNPTVLQACARCGQPLGDVNCPDVCSCTAPGAS